MVAARILVWTYFRTCFTSRTDAIHFDATKVKQHVSPVYHSKMSGSVFKRQAIFLSGVSYTFHKLFADLTKLSGAGIATLQTDHFLKQFDIKCQHLQGINAL